MNVIIVFPRPENGNKIRHILSQSGFEVCGVCTAGAQALQLANGLFGGIIVCGPRFADMMYTELYEYLPPGFEMLLVATPEVCDAREIPGIVCLKLPMRVHELLETMNMMAGEVSGRRKKNRRKPGGRTKEEVALIGEAKELLMERNHMTEEEAHRYIQKKSMDNGTGMTETAQMILSLMGH